MKTKQLTLDAMLAAMCAVLGYVALDMGNIKITFESLPILLGYSGLSDAFLKKYVEDSRALWQDGAEKLDATLISGVIGTHTGPGVVAVAFFRKH